MKSLGELEIVCPHCGNELVTKSVGQEPSPDDRVICPVHGDVGSREEATRIAYEKSRDDVIDKARETIRDLVRRGLR